MTDKTWNVEDPKDLSYRFSWSPVTKEVLVISRGVVIGFFENRESFHRFLIEGNRLDSMIQDPIPDTVREILEV